MPCHFPFLKEMTAGERKVFCYFAVIFGGGAVITVGCDLGNQCETSTAEVVSAARPANAAGLGQENAYLGNDLPPFRPTICS
jgi:hypothetical protein